MDNFPSTMLMRMLKLAIKKAKENGTSVEMDITVNNVFGNFPQAGKITDVVVRDISSETTNLPMVRKLGIEGPVYIVVSVVSTRIIDEKSRKIARQVIFNYDTFDEEYTLLKRPDSSYALVNTR